MSTDSVAVFAVSRLSSAYRSEPARFGPSTGWKAALLATAVVSGCSRGLPLRSDDLTRIVPNEQAFALPEVGGPAVTAVLEKRYTNATEQDILLATSSAVAGQNMLRVQIFGPIDTTLASQDKLRAGYLVAKNVNAEMRQLIPGVRMQTSAYYVQNKYGPFGYAVGRSGSGDTCLYGWQRITSTGVAQTWIGNKGSIQVRLRICDQSASEMRLLQSMYGYTINASFKDGHWNPYGTPLPPDETLGRGGAPIYPVSASRFETVAEPIAEAPAAPKRQSSRQAAVEPRLPAPTGPVVPPPPGGKIAASSRGAVAAPTTASPAGSGPLVPPPPCSTNGTESFCN
jgi:hypothetical protein